MATQTKKTESEQSSDIDQKVQKLRELYAEAATRRRMMSVSAHDRIAGRPSRSRMLEEFITYAQSHPGVMFMRKDEIARFALGSSLTVREDI